MNGVSEIVGNESFIEFQQHGMLNAKYKGQPVEVRRLSTKSKVNAQNSREQELDYFTEWVWYWKDAVKWKKYEDKVFFDSSFFL